LYRLVPINSVTVKNWKTEARAAAVIYGYLWIFCLQITLLLRLVPSISKNFDGIPYIFSFSYTHNDKVLWRWRDWSQGSDKFAWFKLPEYGKVVSELSSLYLSVYIYCGVQTRC
jgi:hypothetical protein